MAMDNLGNKLIHYKIEQYQQPNPFINVTVSDFSNSICSEDELLFEVYLLPSENRKKNCELRRSVQFQIQDVRGQTVVIRALKKSSGFTYVMSSKFKEIGEIQIPLSDLQFPTDGGKTAQRFSSFKQELPLLPASNRDNFLDNRSHDNKPKFQAADNKSANQEKFPNLMNSQNSNKHKKDEKSYLGLQKTNSQTNHPCNLTERPSLVTPTAAQLSESNLYHRANTSSNSIQVESHLVIQKKQFNSQEFCQKQGDDLVEKSEKREQRRAKSPSDQMIQTTKPHEKCAFREVTNQKVEADIQSTHRDSKSRDINHARRARCVERYQTAKEDEVNLEKEEEVECIEEVEGGWTKIRKTDNSVGYVPTFCLAIIRTDRSDETAHYSIPGTQTQVKSYQLAEDRTSSDSDDANLDLEMSGIREDNKCEGTEMPDLNDHHSQMKKIKLDDQEIIILKQHVESIDIKLEKHDRDIERNETKIETLVNENKRLQNENDQLKKGTSFTKNFDETKAKYISLNMKPPPNPVKHIHSQIVEEMKASFAKKGIQLSTDGLSPTVVTVSCASRGDSDIDRDVLAANLTNEEAKNLILMRIIPTNAKDVNQKVENVKKEEYKLDLAFLASQRDPKLHDCTHNSEQFEKLIHYFVK